MGLIIREKVSVDKNFKTLIQSGNYEKVILSIMEASNIIFYSQYIHNSSQGNGECDFENVLNKIEFDAKIPITSEQGKLVGSRDSDLLQFFHREKNELEEFGEYIENGEQSKFEKLTLYQILKRQIEADKSDENLIFLFPFPVVLDLGETAITSRIEDVLTELFRNLKKNNIIGERELFGI